MTADITLVIPDLRAEGSPNGGIRFRSSFGGRSVFGVCRCIPGRLVHVRDVAGERRGVGWTRIDDEGDILSKVFDLLVWTGNGEHPRCGGVTHEYA